MVWGVLSVVKLEMCILLELSSKTPLEEMWSNTDSFMLSYLQLLLFLEFILVLNKHNKINSDFIILL